MRLERRPNSGGCYTVALAVRTSVSLDNKLGNNFPQHIYTVYNMNKTAHILFGSGERRIRRLSGVVSPLTGYAC